MKIPNLKSGALTLIALFVATVTFAQPAREINSFRHFSNADANQENTNAYLLSYLCTLIYPERLAREANVAENTLLNSDSRFFSEYKKRVKHWFYNPNDPKPIAPKAPNEPSMDALANCPQLKEILDKLPKTQTTLPIAKRIVEINPVLAGKLKLLIDSKEILVPEGKIKVSPLSEEALLEKLKKEQGCTEAYQKYLIAVKTYEVAYRFYEKRYDQYLQDFQAWEDRVPEFEYLYNEDRNDRKFRDPEAILISTPTTVFVVFRGTDKNTTASTDLFKEIGEWITTDATALPIAPGNGIRGFVHGGFWNSLSAIKSTLADRVKFYRKDNKKVWISGHSLGGGQAALFASYLQFTKNIPVQGIYVYGSPACVGNKDFASQMNSTFNTRYQRFDFKRDFVTMLPVDLIGMGTAMKYEKSGIRNWINGDTYYFNRGERTAFFDNAPPSFCHHTPEFYSNGLFALITRVNLDRATQLPAPPDRPNANWRACGDLDF